MRVRIRKVRKRSGNSKSKIYKGGVKRMSPIRVNATVVESDYVQDVIREVMRKPSPYAIERNKKASDLVKKLRK